MPANELICPACSSHLKRPSSLRDGDPFECPMCATEFRIGRGQGAITARRPPSRKQVEELEELEEQPGEELEELDEELGEELEVLDEETPPGRRKGRKRSRKSGAVELGRWISLGFAHWLPMLPPSIGFFILFILADILVGFVLSFLGYFLMRALPIVGYFITLFIFLSIMVPLSGGMTLVSVQQLVGRRWAFGEFFSGSQWWLSLVLNYLLLQVFYSIVVGGPSVVLALALGSILHPAVVLLLSYGLATVIYVCLYPLTWMFSWQLIIDGNYGPVESITENFQMALPHYLKLLPLAALTLFIRVVGLFLCGVGFAAAWPLAVLIETTAYLRLTDQHVVDKASEMN